MAVLTARKPFNPGTGVAGTTVAVTGLGFSPDALIFFADVPKTVALVQNATSYQSIGFACRNGAGVDNCGGGKYDVEGGATTDTGGWGSTTRSVKRLGTGLVNTGEGHVSSLDADGFTFTIDVQFAADMQVVVLAIGGPDVSAVGIGNFQLAAVAGTDVSVNVGGKPDAVFLIGIRSTAADTAYHDFSLSFGAASRFDGEQAFWSGGSDHGAATSSTLSAARRGEIYQLYNSLVTSVQSRGHLKSFDTNGFTITCDVGTVQDRMYYLAISGPAFKIGGLTTPTDTVTTKTEDGIGFVPKGFLFVGHEGAENAAGTPTADNQWSMTPVRDMADLRRGLAGESFDGAAGGSVTETYESAAIYANLSHTPGIEVLTDLTTIGQNSFSYKNTTNTIAQSDFIFYIAVGNAPDSVAPSSRGNFSVQGGPGGSPLASSTGQFSVVATEGIRGDASIKSTGQFSVVATEGIRGDASIKSTGVFTLAGTENIGGAPALSSRGDFRVAATEGIRGDVALSSSGQVVSAGTPKVNGAAALSSRGDAVSAGTVDIDGDVLNSTRGNVQVTGTFNVNGDVVLSSGGSFSATGNQDIPGAVSISSRGDAVAAAGVDVPGIPRIFSRGNFYVSSNGALSADVYLSSRGNVAASGNQNVPGAVLLSSRGNFVVTGTIDTQNPYACRPGNIAREVRKSIMDAPTPWVRFRSRANRQ